MIADEDDMERTELYRLFAGLFLKEPADEALVQFKDIFQMEFNETSFEIGMDFVHLFSGAAKHLPPYESFYNYPFGEKPGKWGKVTKDVRSFYATSGLMIDEEMNLAPDHISAELMFMSYLAENGLTDTQRLFLEEHLLKWIPDYCNEIKKHAATVFYREVSDILKEFLLSEREFLNK